MTGTAERAADVLADVEAAARGQVDVEDHEVRQLRVEDAQRLGGVPRLDDGVAGIRQRERDERGQVRIVVDDQELHGASATSGSVTVKRVSPAGVRAARTSPPWRSTMDFTIQRPRPRPRGSGSWSAAR